MCIGYGYLAQKIPLDFWSQDEVINARSLPYLLAFAGSCLSFILVIISLFPSKWVTTFGQMKQRQTNLADGPSTTQPQDWRSLVLMLLLMTLFTISIEVLGFQLSSSLFLMIGFLILGSRSVRLIFLTAIPLVLVIWFILDSMGIYLAKGSLFNV